MEKREGPNLSEQEKIRRRTAVTAKRVVFYLVAAVVVVILVAISLPNYCRVNPRGSMILTTGADKKSMSYEDSYDVKEGFAEADMSRESRKASSPMESAQVSGVWAQPAQAQELSATGRKPMIVYNGDLEVKVSQLKEAADNALKLIDQYQGYMSNMQEYNYETSQSVSITARVPAEKVIQFAEDVKRLGEMISSRLTGDEVTEEYFDLQAQLEALRISEERLKEMLSRSGKLSDLLEIERELSNKQSQINQVEGRMRYLEDRSAMATLNISLVTEAPPSPAIVSFTWDFGQVFSQAWMNLKYSVRGFLHGLIYFIVNAIFWIPVLLVIWLILWLIWRWLRKSGIIEWEPISKKDERGP